MSNTRAWRRKQRTATPNSRQKRNGLFLDAHRRCQVCQSQPAEEAHHNLPKGNPGRYLWQNMKALCTPCHVEVHKPKKTVKVVLITSF